MALLGGRTSPDSLRGMFVIRVKSSHFSIARSASRTRLGGRVKPLTLQIDQPPILNEFGQRETVFDGHFQPLFYRCNTSGMVFDLLSDVILKKYTPLD